MNPRTRAQAVITYFAICIAGIACSTPAGEPLRIDPSAWHLERTWKSAHEKGGARYHFYSGQFRLINSCQQKLENLRVAIRILDPGGKLIKSTPQIFCGSLEPGKSVKRGFSMDRAVQFSELVLRASFTVDDQEKTIEFSATDGRCPQLIQVDTTGTVNELRVLSHEIEQKILGKRTSKPVLVIRVRNLSSVPASRPTARLVFQVDKSAKAKKKRRRHRKSRKKRKDTVKPANTFEIILDQGEIAPGETKAFRKKLPRLPQYNGYSVSISAVWPEIVTEESTPATSFRETRGEGDKLMLGELQATARGEQTILTVMVTNNGDAIEAGKLRMCFILKDADDKEVSRVEHVCKEEFPKGKTVKITLPPQKLPVYSSYEVAVEF